MFIPTDFTHSIVDVNPSWTLTSQISNVVLSDPACFVFAESSERLWLGSGRRGLVFSVGIPTGSTATVLPPPTSCFAGQPDWPDAAGNVREILSLPDGLMLNVSSYAVVMFNDSQQDPVNLFPSNVLARLLSSSGGTECILAAATGVGGSSSPLLIITTEKNLHVFDISRCDTPFTSFCLPPFLRNCNTLLSNEPLKFWIGGGSQGCLGCFDLRQRRSAVRRVVDAHRRAVTSLAISGNSLVSTGLDRDVHDLLQMETSLKPETCRALEIHNKDIVGVAIDRGLASPDRLVKIWDLRHLPSGNVPMRSIEMPLGRGPLKAKFAASGELVVVSSDGNWFCDSLWNLTSSSPEYFVTPISSPLVDFDSATVPTLAMVDLNFHTFVWSPRRYAHPIPYSEPPDPRGNLSPFQLQLMTQIWDRQQSHVPCPSSVVYPSECQLPSDYLPSPPKEIPKSRQQPPLHLAFHPPELVERCHITRRDPMHRTFKYNHTGFPGLENGTFLDFVHPTLVALYAVPQIQLELIDHNCDVEFCLACELGFLFHMMDLTRIEGEGMPCQTINFHRALKHSSEPRVLGITDSLCDYSERPSMFERAPAPIDVSRRAQLFTRFILGHLHKEFKRTTTDRPSPVDETFGHDVSTTLRCLKCHSSVFRESRNFSTDLDYNSVVKSTKGNLLMALVGSLRKKIQAKSFCKECNASTSSEVIKQVNSHPNVLVVNCNVHTFAEVNHWRRCNPTIPSTIWVCLKSSEPSQPMVMDTLPPDPSDWRCYHLYGSIFNVEGEDADATSNDSQEHIQRTPAPSQGHLAMHCRQNLAEDRWIAINDFVVTHVDKDEVVSYSDPWKVPISFWFVESNHSTIVLSPRENVRLSLATFMRDSNISSVPESRQHPTSFVPLDVAELQALINGEFLVGLDAEFVAEDRDITHRAVDSDVSLSPSSFALARVTVIRGQGPLEGIPFIDHYIQAKEAPTNYLTKFSGLKEGDLDPMTCRHWLTTKKAIYQKLRFLVDAGCRFVGHGLWKDFRIINMFVPNAQQVDTVELFRLPRQRFLSLKFLAFHLLGQSIQGETHDSIQDAQVALTLYKYYLDLCHRHCLKECLDHLYAIGYRTGWQVNKNWSDEW